VNFGSVLFTSGRVGEAREQFEAALRIMPDYEPAQRRLAMIRAGERESRTNASPSASPPP
jgi:hypothetical protein